MDTATKPQAIQCSLDFFDHPDAPDRDQILTDKANALLEALNDGLKTKDHYLPQYTYQEGNFIMLIACNKEKDIMHNILDVDGNTPPGMSACWRNASQIKQDLKELQMLNT
jgi:hypothetical protein